MFKPRFWMLVVMVLTGAAMRLIPHPPNFTPIAAIALFAGAHFATRRAAFLVPLIAMFASDLLISGGYHATMPAVYLCFAMTVGFGLFLKANRSPLRIGATALAASVLFFVITNLAVWMSFGFYPKTGAGLISCYVAAIPFFANTVAGNLFFSTVMFGAWALVEKQWNALQRSTVAAAN